MEEMWKYKGMMRNFWFSLKRLCYQRYKPSAFMEI